MGHNPFAHLFTNQLCQPTGMHHHMRSYMGFNIWAYPKWLVYDEHSNWIEWFGTPPSVWKPSCRFRRHFMDFRLNPSHPHPSQDGKWQGLDSTNMSLLIKTKNCYIIYQVRQLYIYMYIYIYIYIYISISHLQSGTSFHYIICIYMLFIYMHIIHPTIPHSPTQTWLCSFTKWHLRGTRTPSVQFVVLSGAVASCCSALPRWTSGSEAPWAAWRLPVEAPGRSMFLCSAIVKVWLTQIYFIYVMCLCKCVSFSVFI